MKKLISVIALFVLYTTVVNAQKIFTKNGAISFFSKASMEDIKADNNQVVSILNTQTGELQFSVIIKSFHFEKALMQEHFNENYLESDKFPKASFKGSITDISKVNLVNDGNYPVTVAGDLTIHGVTNKINTTGTIQVKSGAITGSSEFNIGLADYNVAIPKLVENNISKTIQVTVNCLYNQKM